jgi:hypothetical protein
MIWLIVAMLLMLGAVALLASYTLAGGTIQILLIGVLVAIGIHRIRRFKID